MATNSLYTNHSVCGVITPNKGISGSVSTGAGSTDHNRLTNRDKENQHPISAISNLQEALDNKIDTVTATALIDKLQSAKASGLYYDEKKELSYKAYWYLTSELTANGKSGTKESIISGPYDFGIDVTDYRFVLNNPKSNETLTYDETTKKWVNKPFVDNNSIIYVDNQGLTIKGYNDAKQGQMLVKDLSVGLAWVTPLSDEQLEEKVVQAESARSAAQTAANTSANKAVAASLSAEAANVSAYNADHTVKYELPKAIDNKLQFMTVDEYNALTEIKDGCFYFLTL